MIRFVVACAAVFALLAPAKAQQSPSWTGPNGQPLKLTRVANGLDTPWSLGFLPGGDILVTERGGTLWRISPDGTKNRIRGVPPVADRGQGGLHDVLVPRGFARDGRIYLSAAVAQGRGAGTAVFSAQLSGNRLSAVKTLFQMTPGSSGGRHFGGRLVEARDGTIFLTIGDRGDRPSAQDLGRENGSVVRINPDGTIPSDNPFNGRKDARAAIWSYGHRNPQGAALDLNGRLWVNEHGARGGDEVNRVRRGGNYGWPVIAYGRHYSGLRIGVGTHRAGMEQPAFFWDPSIAPSGMAIYSGRLWPKWRGAFLIGSLKFDHIAVLHGRPLKQIATLGGDQSLRIRDIREGPGGTLWFLSEGHSALYKITPN